MPTAPSTTTRSPRDALPGHPVGGRLRRVRRRVLLHRRGLAAVLAASAVVLVVRSVAAPDEAEVRVWAAAQDLEAGRVVAAGDLRPVALPPDAVPDGARPDRPDLVGRVLAAPVRRGEAITDVRLLGARPADAVPGRVAVPVRLGDPAVLDLLRPGDRVDLAAVDPAGRREAGILVRAARVLFVPERGGVASGADLPGGLVVLAVPEADAPRLADASVSLFLNPVWRH